MKTFLTILFFCTFYLNSPEANAQVTPLHTSLLSDADNNTRKLLEGRFGESYGRLSEHDKRAIFVLKNESPQLVVGYVVKWTISLQGITSSSYQAFDENQLIGNPLRPVSGFGLETGRVRLVTLYGNFHESHLLDQGGSDQFVNLSVNHPMASKMKNLDATSAELDSVIYADGTFEGSDEADLAHTFVLDRSAKHDAGAAVLLAIRGGETEQEIRTHLQSDVAKGSSISAVRGKDGYVRARGLWAQVLLSVEDHLGMAGLTAKATEFARLSKVHLVRNDGKQTQ